MIVLVIRSDKPEAEIGLFDDDKKIAYEVWQAHRELAETIHKKIEVLLKRQKLEWQGIEGIVCYEGPGSFTGLRIGLTVANALAFSLEVPIIASGGEEWQKFGIEKLLKGKNDKIARPMYGAPVHITQQRK